MAKPDCDICCGRGFVRLPVHQSVMALRPMSELPAELPDPARDYACPECEVVQGERVHVLDYVKVVDSRITDPKFQDHVRGGIAQALADKMLRQGLITFDRSPDDRPGLSYAVRGRIGVASPRVVLSIADRIEQAMPDVAQAVVQEAHARFGDWPDLTKPLARTIVEHAAKKVIAARRGAWRKVS